MLYFMATGKNRKDGKAGQVIPKMTTLEFQYACLLLEIIVKFMVPKYKFSGKDFSLQLVFGDFADKPVYLKRMEHPDPIPHEVRCFSPAGINQVCNGYREEGDFTNENVKNLRNGQPFAHLKHLYLWVPKVTHYTGPFLFLTTEENTEYEEMKRKAQQIGVSEDSEDENDEEESEDGDDSDSGSDSDD